MKERRKRDRASRLLSRIGIVVILGAIAMIVVAYFCDINCMRIIGIIALMVGLVMSGVEVSTESVRKRNDRK